MLESKKPSVSARREIVVAAMAMFLAIAPPGVQAAVITWQAAQGISGDGDVSTNGTSINAVNLGAAGLASPTINGVLFSGVAMGGLPVVASGNFSFAMSSGTFSAANVGGAGSGAFAALTPAYQSLLVAIGGDFNTPFSLTMSGLSIGTLYEVELWSNNSNGFPNQQLNVAAGNSLILNSNPSGSEGGVGQFGIGTFVADAATQTIDFSLGPNSVQSFINAVQLRSAAAVPEPATTALFALALLALAVSRRRVR